MSVQEFNLNEYEYVVDKSTHTLKVIKSEMTAEQWVRAMYRRYLDNFDTVATSSGQWTVVLNNKGKVAKACCDTRDKYRQEVGIAIAYARLYNLPIHPDFLPKKKSVSNKTRFEVGETVQGWDGSYGRVIGMTIDGISNKYKVKWFNSNIVNFYFATDLKKLD